MSSVAVMLVKFPEREDRNVTLDDSASNKLSTRAMVSLSAGQINLNM